MRSRTTFRYLALPASAALLALTGCASSGAGGGTASSTSHKAAAQKVIQAAYTTTTAAKSARIAITFEAVGPTSASAAATITGAEDFEHKRSETTSSLAGVGTIEQRQIGSDIYVKLPSSLAATQLVPKPIKPWTHIRLTDLHMPAGLASLWGSTGSDPTAYLKLLTSVTSSVTAVGTDDVRGQQSTHYRMTFDAAKIRKLDEQLGDCGDDGDDPSSDANTPLNVWLDSQGRLTRMQIAMNQDSSTGTSGAPSVSPPQSGSEPGAITFEFYDYGAPVSIEAPPADQTQTINDPLGLPRLVRSGPLHQFWFGFRTADCCAFMRLRTAVRYVALPAFTRGARTDRMRIRQLRRRWPGRNLHTRHGQPAESHPGGLHHDHVRERPPAPQ